MEVRGGCKGSRRATDFGIGVRQQRDRDRVRLSSKTDPANVQSETFPTKSFHFSVIL